MLNTVNINILGHDWEVRFLPKKILKQEIGFDVLGFTFVERFTIDVCIECTAQEVKHILTHEITHAVLCSQGRAFQRKFTQEEVCEFVAWNHKLISNILDEVMPEFIKFSASYDEEDKAKSNEQ